MTAALIRTRPQPAELTDALSNLSTIFSSEGTDVTTTTSIYTNMPM